MDGEPFHEAWDRFKLLLIQCPHHHFPLQLQNQFFYDGLTLQCQFTVDNAAGGAMGEKTADETYEIFEMLGANSQQKSARGKRVGVHELGSNNEMAMQLAELTKQVQLLTTSNANQMPKHEVCGVCGSYGHGANVCSFAGDPYTGTTEEANLMQGYQPRPRNDPYSNTYNPGWRNHPNFGWKQNSGQPFVQNQTQGQNLNRQFPQNKPNIEDTLNNFIQSCNGRIDSIEASVKRVEIQVGQLAEQMYKQETGKLPSQPEQAKAITVFQSDEEVPNNSLNNLPEHSNVLLSSTGNFEGEGSTLKENNELKANPNELPENGTSNNCQLHKSADPYRPPIPPMNQFEKNQDEQYSDTLTLFSGINCNLPLLDIIKNSSNYDPMCRNFIIKTNRGKENDKSEIDSPIIPPHLPLKMKDPGSFNINITMGDKKVFNAMLDLGAGINLMPYSVYLLLGLDKFKETRITLQLANGSIQHPKGIVENLLVQVDKFIVPVDFVVLEMDKNFLKDKEPTIILGRPFMATTKTTIEVHNRKLSMTICGETVQFENFQSSPIFSNIDMQDSINDRIEVRNVEWRGKDKLINFSRDDAYKERIKHANYKNPTWRTKAHYKKDKGGNKKYNYIFNPP